MYDVNPLGPMMHLKQIDREALAFRAARMESRSADLTPALEWIGRLLKGLSGSSRAIIASVSANNVGD